MHEFREIQPGLVFTFGMDVEWDEDKAKSNRYKHGYAFESVGDWLYRATFPTGPGPPPTVWLQQPRDDGEPRWRLLSVDWEGHVIDFVFTLREGRIRLISYRRAHEGELHFYWQHWRKDEVAAWLASAYPSS